MGGSGVQISIFNSIFLIFRGDVFFAPHGVHLLIKWSKTMRNERYCKNSEVPIIAEFITVSSSGSQKFVIANPRQPGYRTVSIKK